MSDIKVSVLTPIYNHDVKYTRKCLESLHAQTLKECEFILIDNGATLEAKSLIEEFNWIARNVQRCLSKNFLKDHPELVVDKEQIL